MPLPFLLFDRNIPNPLARYLTGFAIRRTDDEGWNTLKNGELLDAAERAGYFAMITADRNLCYQQNLFGRRLALLVLSTPRWTELREQVQAIQTGLNSLKAGGYMELTFPRPPLRRRAAHPPDP